MARNPHFAVDDLSEDARRIIRDGLDRRERENAIILRVKAQTGEEIARSSFNRYASWYRTQMARRQDIRERVEVAVETGARMGAQMTAAVQAELLDALMEAAKSGSLKSESATDAFFLGRLALAFSESERKEREIVVKEQALELKRREVDAAEKKLNAALGKERAIREAAEKAKRAMAAAKAAGGTLSDEVEKEILAIYGLTEAN